MSLSSRKKFESVFNELQVILHKKTQEYLTKDNPSPEEVSYFKQFTLFFEGRGEDGRARALVYENKVVLQEGVDKTSLYDRVIQDVLDNGEQCALGTSKRYRRRLLEGLCIYKEVLQDVEIRIQNYRRQMALSAPQAMQMISDEHRINFMLVELKVNLNNKNNLEMKTF